MQLNKPLATVTPTLDGDVLGVLASADVTFTISQIQRVLSTVAGRWCENGAMTTARTLTPQGHEINADRLAEVCRRYGISELSVFGSVARGDAGPASDIDLLFVLEPDARLGFALFDLEAELAEIFDRPVDLLPRESVHRLIRDAVFAEAEVVYAA